MTAVLGPVRRVTVDGLPVAYRAMGSGAPVVLLHGWPTSGYLWRRALPALADLGWRAIAPDLVGLGDSAPPGPSTPGPSTGAPCAGPPLTLDLQARVLDGFLAEVGVQRVALVGHDLGGPVALLWAVRHPDRVQRLVLLDTPVYPRRLPLLRALLLVLRAPGLGRLAAHPAGLRLLLRLGSVRRGGIDGAARREYARPALDRAGRQALLHALLDPQVDEFDEIIAGLPQLALAEVLIAWADHDVLLPRAEMHRDRLRRALPHARTTTIRRAGHFLPEDRPEQVVALLTGALPPADPRSHPPDGHALGPAEEDRR